MAVRIRAGAHQSARSQPPGYRRELRRPAGPEDDPAGGRELELSGWHRGPNLVSRRDGSLAAVSATHLAVVGVASVLSQEVAIDQLRSNRAELRAQLE